MLANIQQSMAAFLSLCLLLLFSLSSAQNINTIGDSCKASRDPSACEAWLAQSGHVPPNATVLQVIQSALSITSQNLDKGQAMIREILKSSTGNKNRTTAARTCLEMVHYADYRISRAGEALTRGKLKDARAWMTASLVYQYDCWSALKYVNDTSMVVNAMVFFNSTLIGGSSSALGMMVNYDIFGERTGLWTRPRTERDGFWEPAVSESGSDGGVPTGLKADVTVCKGGGGCNYTTVQAAVNAAPARSEKRFVIWIKAGVYEEAVRVPLQKKNVVFLGDGMGKTVITGSRSVGQTGVSTYNSATVGVVGDGFMAIGLTIENTAGPDAHQAVAFRSDSDHSMVENCSFIGNQDTLYAHSLRQHYKSCLIQGNVDFIFGNSAALFEGCHILVAPRQLTPEKEEKNAVTAQGRTDPAQSTGFVFRNCVVNGTEAYMGLYYGNPKVHLGRPWKEYSRTVFIECVLEGLVTADGWMPWDGDFALLTLYYGEFGNTGAGAETTNRVAWSSRIPTRHVGSYSAPNFIDD